METKPATNRNTENMLNAIEALYLKTYQKRYISPKQPAIEEQIASAEAIFFHSAPGSQSQKTAVNTFFELLHLQALQHVQNGGSWDDVILTVTSVAARWDQLIGYLSSEQMRQIKATRCEFWNLSDTEEVAYGCFVDTPVKGRKAATFISQINHETTSPRMVLRSFVISRVQ